MKIQNIRGDPIVIKSVTINPREIKEVPGLTQEELMTSLLRNKVRVIGEVKPTWNRSLRRPKK